MKMNNTLIIYGLLTEGEWATRYEKTCRVYHPFGLSPTLHGIGCGGNTEPKILIYKQRATKKMTENKLKEIGKLNIKGMDIIKRVYSVKGISPALTTMMGGATRT